jgi:imidazolonepropionase-like amidohydrolase
VALLNLRLALRAVGWRFRIWSLLVLVALPTFEGVAAQEDLRPAEGLRDKTPRVYALRGARIVAGPDELIDSGVVIVRDRFIEAVGKEIPIPPDAVVLDMAGKTIYPGFLDAYSEQAVTWSNDQGAPYWNAEIRPQLSVARLYRPETATDEARRRQGITARLVAPADGVLKGRSAVVSTGGWSGPRALLRADVALHARLTIPFGRGERGYPNSPMGAVALARQAMYDAQWYHAARDAAVRDRSNARPELNDALEVLTEYLHEGGLVIFDAPNELFCLRAAAFAREFSLRYALRGSGYEYRRLEAIAALKVPVIVPVDFPRPPPVATPEAALSVSLERMLHWDLAPENPARLVAAGVPIALTADGLEDLAAFWPAIRKAVRRGLPPREALRALTSTPAELLGVSDQLGTLAPRKLASMVITEGDLFTTEAKILETWVEGERFRWDSAIDVQGTWQMEIPVRDQRRSSTWIISGPRNRLAAEIRIAPQQPEQPPTVVKATQVTLVGQRLTVVFPAGDLGYEGAARLSVLLAEPPGEKRTWTGHITWPDETRVPVQGVQVATTAPDTSPQEKQESKKNEPAPTVRALFEVNYPLGAYGRSGPPEQPQHVLFTNATIWTCGPQGVLRDASLLIGNGKILAVGKHLDIPPQAIVVDAQGMHITPGIIDCHSHMATDGGINESSQAITAEVRIADFLDCNDVAIYWQLAGGVTAANILHGSANPIGGQNQVIKLRWGALPDQLKFAEAPPGIKFALGENVKRSNVPTPSTRYPQSRMGVEQLLRDAFQAAREYQQLWQRWTQNPTGPPPRRDLELHALVEVLEGKRWIHCHSYRQDEILAFLRVLEDFHITAGSLQHILEGYKVAEVIARHGATASSFADWWAYKFEVYDAIPFNGALMHRAGIIVSFNSDDRELARHLNHEAAKAVKYGGLPAEEALKFVTLNPAKQLRIDAWVGSLEPGKHADFVLWSGPPLSTLSRCEQTWIDGRKYFDRQEDMQLRNRVQEMRAKLVQRILNSGETPDATVRNRRDDSSLWPRYDEFCPFHTHDHFDRQNQEETVQAP